MRQCSASTVEMPCWALPVSSCFGREEGWIFSIDSTKSNWQRDLRKHEESHRTHSHQSDMLRVQAAKVKKEEEGTVWECSQCGARLLALHKAVHHECPKAKVCKRVHRQAAQRHPHVKRRRKSQHPQPLSMIDVPEDLPQASIMDKFLQERNSSADLAQLHPFSRLLTEHAAAAAARDDRPLQVGDFFEWPARRSTFGCVFSIGKTGNYHAIEFRRRPVDTRRPCAIHAAEGGCWRAVLPLVSHEIDAGSDLNRVTLVPRPKQANGSISLGERCFAFCDVSSAKCPRQQHCQDLKEFVKDVAQVAVQGSDSTSSSVTPAVMRVLQDCTTRRLQALGAPRCCPAATDGETCQVRPKDTLSSRLLLTAQGCFRVLADRYHCHTHGRTWTLPAGDNTAGCNLVADVLGEFLVDRDWWPVAVNVFLQTESFLAVEKHVRRQTAAALAAAFSEHSLAAVMSEVELAIVHQGLLAHCRKCPTDRTMKKFLCAWHTTVVAPAVPGLAGRTVCAHGCVLNIDFSASDSRQLTRKRRQAKDSRRTMGSITGLDDVPLLPPLFVDSERRFTVETLCFTAMKLLKDQGMRPIGLNTDDIAAWFETITGCLEAAYPGVVK
eukprot:s829_g12.t1